MYAQTPKMTAYPRENDNYELCEEAVFFSL